MHKYIQIGVVTFVQRAGSGKGAATAAHRRLARTAVVVVRWSWNLDVIFIMFEMLCNSDKIL